MDYRGMSARQNVDVAEILCQAARHRINVAFIFCGAEDKAMRQARYTIEFREIERRVSQRLECSAERCAENLVHYLQRPVTRVRLVDCTVIAKLHAGSGSGPKVKVEFGTPGIYPEPRRIGKSSRGATAAAATATPATEGQGRPYTSREICALLELRLRRLLRHLDFKYGRLTIDIRDGQIEALTLAQNIRTNTPERSLLERFFRSAPTSWIWRATETTARRARSVSQDHGTDAPALLK
jgi:hypothetical protein